MLAQCNICQEGSYRGGGGGGGGRVPPQHPAPPPPTTPEKARHNSCPDICNSNSVKLPGCSALLGVWHEQQATNQDSTVGTCRSRPYASQSE